MSRKRSAARRKIKKNSYLGLFSLIILLVVTLVATIYLIFLRPGTIHKQTKTTKPIERPKTKSTALATPPIKKAITLTPNPTKPRVAIIIDDIGYQRKIAEQFINLDLNLNFSVLPHSPKGIALAKKARDKGRDVLLHLPMEPTSTKWKPGPGALFLQMSPKEREKTLLDDIQAVPLAVGINNHMGSRYTENRDAMRSFLHEVKKRNLFFVDSLTSSHSVGYTLAKELSIKTGKRDVFIDNEKDATKIIKQLKLLIKIATKHGQAIGIGHPHPTTLEALTTLQPLLTDTVSLVAIHEIVQ